MSYFLVYDFDYSMEIKRVHEHRKNKQADKKKWAVISWKEDISCSFNLFLCFIFFLWYYVTCENNQWEKKKKSRILWHLFPHWYLGVGTDFTCQHQ